MGQYEIRQQDGVVSSLAGRIIGWVLALFLVLASLQAPWALAGSSSIVEAEGFACRSEELRMDGQVERSATVDARRQAAEMASSYISAKTSVVDLELADDVVDAYTEAEVKTLEILNRDWDADRECLALKLRAEVTPKPYKNKQTEQGLLDNPAAPLTVKLWTNATTFREGEFMRIFLKGNKPFYGRLIYRDVNGQVLQVLPNPNRQDYYFIGGAVHQVPDARDTFDLMVVPPAGEESLVLYASDQPLGDIPLENLGPVFASTSDLESIGNNSRVISLETADGGVQSVAAPLAEFAEATVSTTVIAP